MAINGSVPDDVLGAAEYIRQIQEKPLLSRSEKDKINQAKLRIAYWALGSEKVPATRENLSYILGADAKEILANYDKSLEREKQERSAKFSRESRDKGREGGFWESV